MTYSKGAVLLHWVMAIMIIIALAIAKVAEDWEGPSRALSMMLHKSLGISVLALTFVRIWWRVRRPPPPMEPNLKKWEKLLAEAAHYFFYFMMLALPISGWLFVSAPLEPKPLTFFGLFDIPYLPVTGNEALGSAMHDLHSIVGNITMLIIALHIAGALKHSWYDKIPSLSRMSLSSSQKRGIDSDQQR